MVVRALAVAATALVVTAVSTVKPAPAASALPSQSQLLATAQQGLATIQRLAWNPKLGWYDDFLYGGSEHMPLARLWSAYPLFEALAGVTAADPTAANKAALEHFADRAAQLYWNPNLKPVGGYEWYPGLRS